MVTDSRQVRADDGLGGWGAPLVPRLLAADLWSYVGLGQGQMAALSVGDGRCGVLHGLGSLWARVLALLHQELGSGRVAGEDLLATLVAGSPEALLPAAISPDLLAGLLRRRCEQIWARLPRSPWLRDLLPSWRSEALVRWVDPAGLPRALGDVTFVPVEALEEGSGELTEALRCLAGVRGQAQGGRSQAMDPAEPGEMW